MRLQLSILFLVSLSSAALAEDRVDSTVTWFSERRAGGESLNVIHPQVDLGVDLGGVLSLGGSYSVDIVSGATPSIYAAPRPGEVDTVTGASQFSETRHVGAGSIGLTGSRSTLTVGYSYGTERDYRSHTITASGTIDLPGKNTILGLSYSRNIDKVCAFDNGDAEPLSRRTLSGTDPCFVDGGPTLTLPVNLDTVQGTLTQNLTPSLVMQIGVYGQIVRGFQANPYRRVRVFQVDAQENVPDVRDRGAAFLRFNLALPGIHAAVSMFGRGYMDSWGIRSGSVEAVYHQYIGQHILLRVRGRGYQQTGAVFFRDARDYELMGPAGEFFTGDREHAPLRTALAGGKLSYLVTGQQGQPVLGVFDDVDFHIQAEGLWTMPMTDNPPGGDVSGPLPDAIIASLGLLLRY